MVFDPADQQWLTNSLDNGLGILLRFSELLISRLKFLVDDLKFFFRKEAYCIQA